jgi:large subunit ribosomal protein L10
MKGSLMARPEKTAAVAELVEDFKSAQATLLTEYRGLSVTSLKALRRSLGNETKYSVVKNTLTKIAAKDAGVDIDEALLAGPSALAFIKGDPIAAAKSLKTFQKENPALVIKGGIYEGKRVTAAEIMELADLESREVLLSKLAGAMKASMAKAARAFDALRIKMESGAPASEAAPAAEAPAAEAVTEAVAEAPVAEAPAAEAPVAEAAEAPAAEATPEVSTESTTEATPE